MIARLTTLTGGEWDLSDHVVIAAGSDVDLMIHVVDAYAASSDVHMLAGDWYGFLVGCQHRARILEGDGRAALACLCVPSVRNGHVTEAMGEFVGAADAVLLNLNLLPTMLLAERAQVARDLRPVLDRAVLSVSFSRGWGLTASQLGVALVPPDHPLLADARWEWTSYFYNALAAHAFMHFDHLEAARVDRLRRDWVAAELARRGLPPHESGTYYVKSFRVDGEVPAHLLPLVRGNEPLVRLCFKPPMT